MSSKRVCVTTLGCRLNQFESDALERLLREGGYGVTADDAGADIHILNSCTITHQADREARQLVAQIRKRAPDAHIVVTGCYATAAAKEVARLPGVGLVVGNADKGALLQHLDALGPAPSGTPRPSSDDADNADNADNAAGHGAECAAPAINNAAARVLTPSLPATHNPRRSRAYLKVQDGCDYRCAFCIVPTVRGKSRSLDADALLTQLDELVAASVPEVVLTGVHLGTYGRDLTPRVTLVDLLKRMLPRLGATRLRLSSLDPHEVSDALIDLMVQHPNALCRYLHLPVQSCDAGVLRRMRRAHTVDDLTCLIPRLVAAMPDIGIGSDVIVGFPGETEQAFANTYDTLANLPMAYMHVFSYSQRDGTDAATMADQVPAAEIARRSHALRALSARKRCTFAEQFIGQTLSAVVHRQRHAKHDKLVAVTDNYIKVHIDDVDAWCGQTVQVVLEHVGNEAVTARIVRTPAAA